MFQIDRKYTQWNYTTACCFKYKAHCDMCPNEIICSTIKLKNNEYRIHPAKYAMLKTYATSTEPYTTGLGKEGYWRKEWDDE